MRFLACIPLLAALAAGLPAQSPRPSVLAGDALGSASAPAVASDGDLAAVAWHDSADESIRVATSDGRGLAWSSPARADAGVPSIKIFEQDALAVAGDAVYLAWRDRRNLPGGTAEDLFFQASYAGGAPGTWQAADLAVDKGLPAGGNDIRFLRMAVDARGAGDGDDVIAFLMAVEDDLTGREALFLNASVDGGRSFLGSALPVTTHNGSADVDDIDLVVAGTVLHCLWRDDSRSPGGADDVWYSAWDAAASTFVVQDIQLNVLSTGVLDADDGVALAVRGSVLAALWQADSAVTAGPEELRGTVSTSGPLGWGAEAQVGGYTPGLHDVDRPDVAVLEDGSVLAAWEDDRSGSNAVYAARFHAGSWAADDRLSPADGLGVRLAAAGAGAAALWTAARAGADPAEAALWDAAAGGWAPAIQVSSNTGDVDGPVQAWNPFYENLVMAWRANDLGSNDAWAAGFRPQTLEPAGDFGTPGSLVHFEVAHWPAAEAGSHAFGVLVSGSPGTLPLADGRDLGLTADPILQLSRSMIPGLLAGIVAADGTGSTPPLAVPPLPGTVYAVAIAFQGPAVLGAITDPRSLP